MSKIFPFTTSQLLTDSIFVAYGGQTGTSTALQREASYVTAEYLLTYHLNALLVPTVVTGSYNRFTEGSPFPLDWTYLSRIYEIQYVDTKGTNYFTISGTNNFYAAVRSYERSYVDLFWLVHNCGVNGISTPYQYNVVYESGLPDGIGNSPMVLGGLTTLAQIALNNFMGSGNETPGGMAGIKSFRNQEYSETRMGLINTVFGQSPLAQWVLKLMTGIRKRQGLRF